MFIGETSMHKSRKNVSRMGIGLTSSLPQPLPPIPGLSLRAQTSPSKAKQGTKHRSRDPYYSLKSAPERGCPNRLCIAISLSFLNT